MAFFAPDHTPGLTHTWTEDDVEVASTAAIHFIKAFYQSMDNVVERLPLLARFYSDRSTLIWNGTKATGMSEIGALLQDVPPSHSEPLSVDCHPIAGTPYPRLLITVQGSITHIPPSHLTSHPLPTRLGKAFYTPLNDAHTYPDIPSAVRPDPVPEQVGKTPRRPREATTDAGDDPQPPPLTAQEREDLSPRMFHEVFVLANVEEAVMAGRGGDDGRPVPPVPNQQPMYTILSDTFRFVG